MDALSVFVETFMRSSFVLILLFAGFANAADTRWGLRWKAPDECISPSELAALVEKKLGRSVFGANPDYRVEGAMEGQAADPKWRARVTVVSAQGDVLGSREVVGTGDCRSLDERVAFIVSVSIDENVVEAPKPEMKLKVEPLPPPRPIEKTAPPNSVYVEIESDSPNTSLMRINSRGHGSIGGTAVYMTTWEKACVAPCKAFVEKPWNEFYLNGDNVIGVGVFTLKDYSAVKIKLRGGSLGARFAGVLLASLGGAVALVGGLFALIGGLTSNTMPGVQNPYDGVGNTFLKGGIGMAIGGGVALAAGIPLIAFSGSKIEFLPLPSNGLQTRDTGVTEL